MKIAADPKLAKAAHAQLLPPHWGTVYELTKLPVERFEQAAASGAIHPEMTRKDVSKLVLPIKITHETKRIPIVSYVTQEPTPLPPLPLSIHPETLGATLLQEKLERLEKIVMELNIHAQQHSSMWTTLVEKRIRAAANKLSALIGQSGQSH